MLKTFDIKLSASLIMGFILFTIIGTLSHELGHFAFAKLLGHEASINYAFTQSTDVSTETKLEEIYKKYSNKLPKGIDYPEKKEYETLMSKLLHDDFIITLGGPLQTMLTGTIGFMLMYYQRKKYWNATKLNLQQWLIIFITLFWLRQLFNFVQGSLEYLFVGRFPTSNDEVNLANHLHIHQLSITSLSAAISAALLCLVVFKYIPIPQRFTFIVSACIGGLLGFCIWLMLLGPILMP